MTQKSDVLTQRPELKIDDRPVRWIGIIIVLVVFGGFILWSVLAPLDSSALAPGVVTVKSYRKTIQHLDGGIVKEILAKDGDRVVAGQVLVRLDKTQIQAQLEIIRGQYLTSLAQVARLRAERDDLETVVFPEILTDSEDPRAKEALTAERDVFRSRQSTYHGEISVLKKRIEQINSKIVGMRGQISSKKHLQASFGEEIKDLRELLAEGFADQLRLRELERNQSITQGEIAALQSDIASSGMQIGEAELEILQLRKNRQEEVTNMLSEALVKLYDATERLTAVQDQLQRTEIRAPVDGMVLGLSVHTEGGVVAPGNPILDIVPQDAELIIEAQVSTMDIDRVAVGLMAEVRFSAFKQALVPKLTGRVIHLSADRLVDEKTGMPYYQARVELTEDSSQDMGDLKLLPGMPAEVLINTGERTLLEYLAQPITNAFARAFIED
ncbi:MAG: HlyD family type I secretion periplasmic adaptor subunit [Methylococcales bacterium]|nr:HlyD family type I secretion periplasmic adaptor subunit [Methylococcales bacterium]